MCLLNCARVNDHFQNSETRPRSPFDRLNFVCLSPTLRTLGFHTNKMENRCQIVLKRCVNVIGRNACACVTYKVNKSFGMRLADNFVKISGRELRTAWRRSKLKDKV